jgi:hypothetical protein
MTKYGKMSKKQEHYIKAASRKANTRHLRPFTTAAFQPCCALPVGMAFPRTIRATPQNATSVFT